MQRSPPPPYEKNPPKSGPPQQTPKDVLTEFADFTTCHGLGRISGSPFLWLQGLWGLITLTCAAVVCWQLAVLIDKYYSYPIVVEVSHTFTDLAYPAVTICNHNRFRKSQQELAGSHFLAALESYQTAIEADMSGEAEDSKRRKRRAAEEPKECADLHGDVEQCEAWAEEGDCIANPGYMSMFCAKTCLICGQTTAAPPTTAPPPTLTVAAGADPATEYFSPNVSLEDKPWFSPDEVVPAVATEIAENMTVLLRSVPLDVQRTMGHKIDTMIQECTWNGRMCTPINFTGMSNFMYGNCYTFNKGSQNVSIAVEKEGPLYGLSLVLFLEQDEYIRELTPTAGVRVLVHHPDEQPFPEDDGFDANPGQKMSVKISVTKRERLDDPYSNCTRDPESLSKLLMYDRNYSVRACRKTCQQKHIYSVCGCGSPALPLVPPKDKMCGDKDLACIESVIEKVNSGEITDKECECPVKCFDLIYKSTASAAEWPAESYLETLAMHFSTRSPEIAELVKNPDELKRNFLKLEVFFEELRYRVEVENPAYRLENLMGDIGGQLGLWIGISVLTLIEFGQLFVELLTLGCRNKRNKVAHRDKI